MKRYILLFAALTCSISITFPGGGQSTPATPKIKIAKMNVLEQRLGNEIVSLCPRSPHDETDLKDWAQKNKMASYLEISAPWVLRQFAGKSFADGDAILTKYSSVLIDVEDAYRNDRFYDHSVAAMREATNKSIKDDQDLIKRIQPIILELILKTDHPAVYEQLKSRLTPPAQ